MSVGWNEAIKYAKLVKLAESVRPGQIDSQVEAQIEQMGYQYLQTLYASDLATDINPHPASKVSFGFIAISSGRELVIALRGTDTILEWIHDADFGLKPWKSGNIDDGFGTMYGSLATENGISAAAFAWSSLAKEQAPSVTCCGHSLGAAMSNILALDIAMLSESVSKISPLVYTFASPRTGDDIFADAFDKAVAFNYRIANRMDLVTWLPPFLPLPYRHVKNYCELKSSPDMNTTIQCTHHLSTYLHLMGKEAGQDFPLDADCVKK